MIQEAAKYMDLTIKLPKDMADIRLCTGDHRFAD